MFRLATSCEMSRLNCFHYVAHHQTEKPVWTWFSGCGQLSECHRSIQRWNLSIANPSVLLQHQFQCVWWTGCWGLHSPPPWCSLSPGDGWLGPSWKEKDGRGLLISFTDSSQLSTLTNKHEYSVPVALDSYFCFFFTLIVSSAPGGSRSSGAEERTSGHLLHCLFSFLLPLGCHWDAGLFYHRMSPSSNFASMMGSIYS